MDSLVLISAIGSIASIISFFMATPNAKSRFLHIAYSVILTVTLGSAIYYNESIKNDLSSATKELEQLKSVKEGAKALANEYYGSSYVGNNRGFILSSFAFLEANKTLFPESYEIAKELVTNGLRITESTGRSGSDGYYDEQKRMEDGAQTMQFLLKGIAARSID